MPKFSTVQAYADSNSNVQTVSYEQATGGSSGKVHTEKVVNAYGSTAGANSGEFHVYRQARAREKERMKNLTREEQERQKDADFHQKLSDFRDQEEERTAKRRKKRQRQKEAKLRRKNLEKAGILVGNGPAGGAARNGGDDDDDEDEFAVPLPQQSAEKEEQKSSTTENFANDGSFLELAKQKLASEGESKQGPEQVREEERQFDVEAKE